MELVSTLPYKFASSLPHLVMQRLASVVADEIGKVWKVDDKLRELQATYMEIEALLAKLDCWQIANPTLELWLQDLERYCYDTEDLVEDLILRRSSKERDEKPSEKPVRGHVFMSGRFTIPHKIVELNKKLQVIGSQIRGLLSAGAINSTHFQTRDPSVHSGWNFLSDKTPLVSGTSRERVKQSIILELTNLQSNSRGVSIIGMDGLGKTSLTRTIFEDDKIGNHFPIILSARVSASFQIGDTVDKLVADHSRRRPLSRQETPESDQRDLILQHLCTSRSLIILDDLWGVIDVDWDYFVHNFLNLNSGSRILTTTRNPKVAEVTESTSFYLNKMTDDDCKRVIIHRAKLSESECESWAEGIEAIAKKCQGMPIVANKLGLKLSKKKADERKDTIEEFKRNELWQLQEFREVFPSLNLNEPKLPPDIKRCFTYCSLFSSNHEFNKDDLTQLWEVEGFIPHQQTRSSKQAINKCFGDLLSRSILQPFKSRDSNTQMVYKMHEFNQEFAHILASKAFRRLGEGIPNLLSSCEILRHLSLTRQIIDEPLLKKIEKCKCLRTFLLLHEDKPQRRTISYNFFNKLEKLRLLDLSHTNISILPNPFSPSKYLRYLDLSYTEVKKLPESIHSLRSLQILKLQNCSRLVQLPKDLNQLISLTHLYVNMKALVCVPLNMGKLIKLEVLDSFDVGKDEGCKAVELKNMKHLTEIHISGLENIGNREEAEEAMLIEKPLLRTLVLEWDSTSIVEVMNTEEVLQSLEPDSHLKNLVVRNYPGKKFPTWMISTSCQLVSIHLDNFQNCEVLPSLGQLPILKNLVLRSIHNVKILDNQSCGRGERLFPCLDLLEFRDMEILASWTGLEAGDMPNLRVLKVVDCPSLVNLPSFEHLSSLVNLEINNCPELPSLPELPSMNCAFEELIIIDSDMVTERCQMGGADWTKIKDVQFVEIDAIRVLTRSCSQHLEDIKEEVQMKEPQHPTNTVLLNENNVSQDQVPKDEDHPTTMVATTVKENNVEQVQLEQVPSAEQYPRPLSLRDEIHTSQLNQSKRDHETTSEDQPTSSQLQPASLNKKDEGQRNKGPAAPFVSKISQIEDYSAVNDSNSRDTSSKFAANGSGNEQVLHGGWKIKEAYGAIDSDLMQTCKQHPLELTEMDNLESHSLQEELWQHRNPESKEEIQITQRKRKQWEL